MTDPVADLGELPGVPSAIAAALAAVDTVLRDRGPRKITPEQSAAALLAGANASVELEQLDASTDWLAGAGRLYSELLPLAAVLRVAPGQALARAHVLLARNRDGGTDESAGRLRDDPEAASRMASLAELLVSTRPRPTPVLAAVAHAEIAAVAPFGRGDGVLARAVEHMVLVSGGIDPRGALVPECGHLAAGTGYRKLLRGYQAATVDGVKSWILHCVGALAVGAERSPLGPARPSKGEPGR